MLRSRVLASLVQRQFSKTANDLCKIQTASFKSHVSIDKIYPDSNLDYLRRPQESGQSPIQRSHWKDDSGKEQFSGYIPIDELEISATKSSGPGGQNVNKVNSKVEVRFHLQTASWIPDWVKPRLAEQEYGKITKDGFLVVRSDMTRKQMLNQADCLNKLRNMVYAASILPKEPTKEEIKLKEERMAKAKSGILREKRRRSLVKQNRSSPEF